MNLAGLIRSPALVLLAVLSLSAEGGASEQQLAAELRFLASDELAGRRAGEVGNQVAARYIAEQFRAAGVALLPGHRDYLLPLPLVSVEPAPAGTIELAGRRLESGLDFIVLSGSLQGASVPAAIVDLQAGVALAEDSLKGRMAVAPLTGMRGGLGALEGRRRRARQAGAVAVLDIFRGQGWDILSGFLNRPRVQLAEDAVEDPLVHILVHDSQGGLLESLAAQTDLTIDLDVAPQTIRELAAHNVGGLIVGSDPRLSEEFVLLTAHFDHVGAGADIRGATPEDVIFNGARDNAMGVIALLEAARQLADSPPARSVILLAVNAEEQGLLGSRHYAANPAVPLTETVFVLNTDSGGFTDTGAVTLIGTGRTTADPVIESATREMGLQLLPDPAGANLFRRSDNISFASRGIPALTLSPGMHRFDAQTMPHYHRPSDEAGPDFDYAYLAVFADAYAHIARSLADHPGRFRWNEDQPYAETARRLYGTGNSTPRQ